MLENWQVCDLEEALVVEASKETRHFPQQLKPTQAIRCIADLADINASADTMRSRQLTYVTGNSVWEACGLQTLLAVKPIEQAKMPSIQLKVLSAEFQIFSKM